MSYQTERYHRNRKRLVSFLGGQCVDCGKRNSLELDHSDPAVYSSGAADALKCSWPRICQWASNDKIELRCMTCHRKKTKLETLDKLS